MTFGTGRSNSSAGYDHRRLPPNALQQRALGGATLVLVAALCAWTLCSTLADTSPDQINLAGTRGDKLVVVARRGDKLVILKPSLLAANVPISLFDPSSSLGSSTGPFTTGPPLRGDARTPSLPLDVAGNATNIPPMPLRGERVAQKVVLPIPRPASAPQIASDSPPAKPSIFATIFQKLFGKPAPVKLAYAATDDGGLGAGQTAGARYDQWTAVYDISAHTVYMPDGTQLEAHSGLGSWLDDPNHADEKMRGVTPPNVYNLQLREELFHGVRALRLIPQDEQKVFGRAGLLAHSFMLGANGDSNGCVSIRNYDAFLQAYLNHEVKRLVVVARLE
jgi:type VI secretion system (T6SS) effector TldE1-like protein